MATTTYKNYKNNKCGVIVFRKKDNKFLIVKNRTSQFWGFPKGHQEEGETTINAAIRELHEEAGIQIKEEDILYSLKKRSWYLYIVMLDNVYVKIDNNEICAFKWIDYSAFRYYNMSKGTAMFVYPSLKYPLKHQNTLDHSIQSHSIQHFNQNHPNHLNRNYHGEHREHIPELQKMENVFRNINHINI
jgi:bis(5'-nucleosidyl)-tetraphosphatase